MGCLSHPPTVGGWGPALVHRAVGLWLGARVVFFLGSHGRASPDSVPGAFCSGSQTVLLFSGCSVVFAGFWVRSESAGGFSFSFCLSTASLRYTQRHTPTRAARTEPQLNTFFWSTTHLLKGSCRRRGLARLVQCDFRKLCYEIHFLAFFSAI